MARKVQIVVISCLLIFASCKKSEDRSCWKFHGEESSLEIPIVDSVHTWYLNKGIKYRIFQDSSRKIVVKGGKNMLNLVEVKQEGTDLTVNNHNKCNFLRSAKRHVEVEIHYPYVGEFYFEPSDSVIFEGTIVSDTLRIQLAFGGGTMVLDADADYLNVVVSRGTGDYILSGQANHAEVKVQDKGFADATNFTASSLFAYQNSTADLKINTEGAGVLVIIDGTGDVYMKGTPTQLTSVINGSGQLIQF